MTGKFGSALSFDGSTNYVDLGTGSQYNFADTTFSVSAWFKTKRELSNYVVKRRKYERRVGIGNER